MKIISLILAIILGLCSTVSASDVVNEGLSDLALSAQHYYNTSLAEADMTISRLNAGEYMLSYTLENGTEYNLTLYLTGWGTWNLGIMSFVKDGVQKKIVSGSTDWEYVFRVLNPISQSLEFTGGNHGSEKLLSIRMYDDVTKEEIVLEAGESKTVRRLVVEENTSLLLANKETLPYANVQRKYTMAGNIVSLDTRIEFVRNVQMALSYSAMASVSKDFGRYCSFDDKKVVQSYPTGSASNEYLGMVDAMVCTLSGDDPSATLTVGIFNKEDMTDNFDNDYKTMLWDMSEGYTKLYFSKYQMSAVNDVDQGTVWNFSTYWRANL